MATRKDFEATAAIIRAHMCTDHGNASDKAQRDTAASIARDFANNFAASNGRFDRGRYYRACGLDVSGRTPTD